MEHEESYESVIRGIHNGKRYSIRHAAYEAEEAVTDHYGRKCRNVESLSSVSPAFKRAQIKGHIQEAQKELAALDAIQPKYAAQEDASVSARRAPPTGYPPNHNPLTGISGVAVDPN